LIEYLANDLLKGLSVRLGMSHPEDTVGNEGRGARKTVGLDLNFRLGAPPDSPAADFTIFSSRYEIFLPGG
jgi:hypothetical protein